MNTRYTYRVVREIHSMVLMVDFKVQSIRISFNICDLNISTSSKSNCTRRIKLSGDTRTIKEEQCFCCSNNKLTLNVVQNKFVSMSNTCNCKSCISTNRCCSNRINSNNITDLISRTTSIINGGTRSNNTTISNSNVCCCSSSVTS